MSYIHIKPTFNCLVKIETLEKVLDKNKIYSFLSNQNPLNIIVYPLINTSNSLPYCFKFDEQNPICQKNVDVISFPQNNFLLTLSPFLICTQKILGEKTKSLHFGGANHTLTYFLNTTFNIKLETENTYCEQTFNEKICSLNTKTIQNNVLIYAKLKSNTGFIFCNIAFENNAYRLISLEKINILEEKNNFIYTYKQLNDIAHHGEVCKYSIPNYKKISYLVYDNNSPQIIKHQELIPFAFFDAIKFKNFKLARSYLSPELSSKLSNTHLTKFFGNFTNVCLPLTQQEYNNEIALIYQNSIENTHLKKYAKIFKVTLEKNKINNIYEI